MNTNELTSVEKYVKRKLESPVAKPVDPILLNPDLYFQNKLLTEGNVDTSFFRIQGSFKAIDTEQFIQSVLTHVREELEAAGKTSQLEQGKLFGTKIGLEMRITNLAVPAQFVESLLIKGSRGSIDLRSLIPYQYPILWLPGEEVSRGAFNNELGLMMVSGDITSPEGMFAALHESCHAQDSVHTPQLIQDVQDANYSLMAPNDEEIEELRKTLARMSGSDIDFAEELKNQFEPVTAQTMKVFLENERHAWAYALRKMAEITDDKKLLQSCRAYMHDHPLRRNSDFLRSRKFV